MKVNFNGTTTSCHHDTERCEEKSSFSSVMEEKAASKKKAAHLAESYKQNMTMEEYKQYVNDKIRRLPRHPSNMQDIVSVQISDAGWEAMKHDPEYESWVFDMIKSNLDCTDPWSGVYGGKYVIFCIGATKEECRSDSFRMERPGRDNKEDDFWERRKKRRKKLLKEYEELLRRRAAARRKWQEQYDRAAATARSTGSDIRQSPEYPGQMPPYALSAYKTSLLFDNKIKD